MVSLPTDASPETVPVLQIDGDAGGRVVESNPRVAVAGDGIVTAIPSNSLLLPIAPKPEL